MQLDKRDEEQPVSAINAVGVVKAYSATPVLRGIDLSVAQGAIVALLGPNGAGKTTLVEILEGHRMRTGGTLSVLGLDPAERTDFRSLRQRMGVVLQQTMLEPGISSRDLLRRQSSYYSHPMEVQDILCKVGLADKQNDLVRTLSGGMRRRLDIALALIGHPEILFLDEPTTGLDPLSRRSIRELIREVNSAGTTVILTSHDLEEVQDLAHTVHVLSDGAFIASGSPREIIAGSHSKTQVRFLLGGIEPSSLPAGAEVNAGMVRYETLDQDHLIAALQRWSTDAGQPLQGLTVIPPSLDDAYATLLQPAVTTGGNP